MPAIGDEVEFPQLRKVGGRIAGVPAQEQANILEITMDGGGGEIGVDEGGTEGNQPNRVGPRWGRAWPAASVFPAISSPRIRPAIMRERRCFPG